MPDIQMFTPNNPAPINQEPAPAVESAAVEKPSLLGQPEPAALPAPAPVSEPEPEPAPEPEALDDDPEVALGLRDPDPVDPSTLFDDDDDHVSGDPVKALTSARARRRIAETEARRERDEATRLRSEVEELRKLQIDDASIKEYLELKQDREVQAREAKLGKMYRHYDQYYRVALEKAIENGDERPVYAADQWVAQQMQQAAPPPSADQMRQIVAETYRDLRSRERDEEAAETTKRTQSEQRRTFITELSREAKGNPSVKPLAADILKLWEADGRKFPASHYAGRLTAPARKAGSLAVAARAEHARNSVPLGGARGVAPPSKATDNNVLQKIQDDRMEVGELIAAIQSGRLKVD
ncbi:MAG TPA: hypothetical protein VFH61_07655 [Thermoleophilia bacterium]|nr:hypothetical protein [Thermoleophilia bacterium]